jgi:uncharacterized protein
MDKDAAIEKMERLKDRIRELDSLMVAFSGGVDSTFLLAVAQEILGNRVMAATAESKIHPRREIQLAKQFSKERGIRHIVFPSEEMQVPAFLSNHEDRCYHCKKYIFSALHQIREKEGITTLAHGANSDDLNDYRPGIKAAIEAGVIAPLADARLSKDEIRFFSKEMGLPTWDKTAMACLVSRIPYNVSLTEEKLEMIDRAENFLLDQGFRNVRVRHHGTVARIEVEKAALDRFIDKKLRTAVVNRMREIGFDHISLDLEGYISGKMNRDLRDRRF